jgi:hemerythrin-like domain-containing protein
MTTASSGIETLDQHRRMFLRGAASATGLALAGLAVAGAVGCGRGRPEKEEREGRGEGREAAKGEVADEAEVTPGEDLMQEHGVLERVLLIYDEAARRIDHGDDLDPALLAAAAGLIHRFVEDYHEKQEEDFVFPRLEAAGRETALVAVLRRQHARGRAVTDEILRRAAAGRPDAALGVLLRAFERMYRPHAAREDTVLFPAFRQVVGGSGYLELGEKFEEREHEVFGERGFEDAVAEVARIEAALGLADLDRFTP